MEKPKYQTRFEDEIRQAVRQHGMDAVIYIDKDGIRMDVKSNNEKLNHKEFGHQFDLIASIRKAIAKITPKEEKND